MNTLIAQVLREYGSCIRGDWSTIDGRSVRAELEAVATALDGGGVEVFPDHPVAEYTIFDWRERLGMCPAGLGHWTDYCDEDCASSRT